MPNISDKPLISNSRSPRNGIEAMDEIVRGIGRSVMTGTSNIPVFYWRTDCGVCSLPKKGTTIAETSDFIIVIDAETGKEEALYKEDYAVSTEMSRVLDTILWYIEYHETEDCTVVFSDEQMNVLTDFLKLVINND